MSQDMDRAMALAYRAEGERLHEAAQADRKAAEKALADAEYQRGQAAKDLRDQQAIEASIKQREAHLASLNEAALVAREKAVEQSRAEVEAIKADYTAKRNKVAAALSFVAKADA